MNGNTDWVAVTRGNAVFQKTTPKSDVRACALNVYKRFPPSVELSKTTKLNLLDSLLQEVCIVTSEFTRASVCQLSQSQTVFCRTNESSLDP